MKYRVFMQDRNRKDYIEIESLTLTENDVRLMVAPFGKVSLICPETGE